MAISVRAPGSDCIKDEIGSVEFVEENPHDNGEIVTKNNRVYKKIPILIHDDKPICESLIIVQYIDDIWANGPSLLPSDPMTVPWPFFWACYIDDKVS